MTDYDFKQLNDKEFEIFCADLLGDLEGRRFERFKPGKDAGVDGRYFTDEGNEVVLQCKHWINTPITQLIRKLRDTEKPKLDKLKPQRYLLAISNALSRANKTAIHRALSPYLLSESDIFGQEDLNDLLSRNIQIEQRHYKLWLHTSSVFGHIVNLAILSRSAFSLEEIIRSNSRYVVTANHQAALNILERLGVVIITGEPGIGKTTLADHLCLHYVNKGFAYLKIAEDIREAESAIEPPDTKHVIYFDDFLGRNYLEALRGHEGNQITQFIRRIATNKNKRFVLTSRSTILNQGKFLIDSLEHSNLQRNEFELRIQSLTELEKAQILYNHIWHSNLGDDYVEQLYLDLRYRKIIAHQSFNPRLISYITDSNRLEGCEPPQYWDYISQALTNPSLVWENPFNAQQDDFGRAIILLVVLNGTAIAENVLAEAYHRFIALPESQNLHGRREFQSNIRLLAGSFLNRIVPTHGPVTIDLFNPSIGDYVLKRYMGDVVTLRLGLLSLRTFRSTITLKSLQADGYFSKTDTKTTCDALFEHLTNSRFEGANVAYLSALCDVYKKCGGLNVSPALRATILFILNEGSGEANGDSYRAMEWGMKQSVITPEQALDFVSKNLDVVSSYDDIKAMFSLVQTIPTHTTNYGEIAKLANDYVIQLISENFSEYIDVNEAFSKVEYGDIRHATKELEKLVEAEFTHLNVDFSADDVIRVVESYDVVDELNNYFENSYDGDDRGFEGPATLGFDEIDDLFDRG